ncbi:MAG: hypothetical protein AB7O97_14080 [Planctomycetota bacterium]
MTDATKDTLGKAMTADERELLALYRKLHQLSGKKDLPPCALMNVKQAMVLLWNACNDLCLIAEEPGCD